MIVTVIMNTALTLAGLLTTIFVKDSVGFENFLLCYTCSSVNASLIIGGAGVDPGVFLSTIPLASVPVTRRCTDPYESKEAIRVGVSTDFCDNGLCVKMNFTNKQTGADNQCYSCTTVDADKLLSEVTDPDWRQWLLRVRDVPQSGHCGVRLNPNAKSANLVPTNKCANGVCMKLWFKQRHGGGDQVWRTCIPNGKGQIRIDCTKVISAQGDMDLCTCDGNLCNGANEKQFSPLRFNLIIIFMLSFVFYCFVLYA